MKNGDVVNQGEDFFDRILQMEVAHRRKLEEENSAREIEYGVDRDVFEEDDHLMEWCVKNRVRVNLVFDFDDEDWLPWMAHIGTSDDVAEWASLMDDLGFVQYGKTKLEVLQLLHKHLKGFDIADVLEKLRNGRIYEWLRSCEKEATII